MLKMFSTQLSGLFKRIQDKEELAMEDSARLLAQAVVGSGKLYLFATNEMKAVAFEATEGQEPLKKGAIWNACDSLDDISEADRFLIISRYSTDEEAVNMGKSLVDKGIPFAAISTVLSEEEGLVDLADVHIDLTLKKGLLPDEVGNRFGFPASMAALFAYYGIRFIIDEILEEYE
jgi:Domain of unknown function (DUF2529)